MAVPNRKGDHGVITLQPVTNMVKMAIKELVGDSQHKIHIQAVGVAVVVSLEVALVKVQEVRIYWWCNVI